MVNRIQADYEMLEDIVQQFIRCADAWSAHTQQTRACCSKLMAGDWCGQGAHNFFNEMQNLVFPAVNRLTDALHSASQSTRRIIRELQRAEDEAGRLFQGYDLLVANMSKGPGLNNPLQQGGDWLLTNQQKKALLDALVRGGLLREADRGTLDRALGWMTQDEYNAMMGMLANPGSLRDQDGDGDIDHEDVWLAVTGRKPSEIPLNQLTAWGANSDSLSDAAKRFTYMITYKAEEFFDQRRDTLNLGSLDPSVQTDLTGTGFIVEMINRAFTFPGSQFSFRSTLAAFGLSHYADGAGAAAYTDARVLGNYYYANRGGQTQVLPVTINNGAYNYSQFQPGDVVFLTDTTMTGVSSGSPYMAYNNAAVVVGFDAQTQEPIVAIRPSNPDNPNVQMPVVYEPLSVVLARQAEYTGQPVTGVTVGRITDPEGLAGSQIPIPPLLPQQ